MKRKKDYDPKVSAMALFKFFNILKQCIIEQDGKVGWIINCTNIRLYHGLKNRSNVLHKQYPG